MELAVWEFPREGEGRAEYEAILAGCENLWKEHILAKLAIPEVRPFCWHLISRSLSLLTAALGSRTLDSNTVVARHTREDYHARHDCERCFQGAADDTRSSHLCGIDMVKNAFKEGQAETELVTSF